MMSLRLAGVLVTLLIPRVLLDLYTTGSDLQFSLDTVPERVEQYESRASAELPPDLLRQVHKVFRYESETIYQNRDRLLAALKQIAPGHAPGQGQRQGQNQVTDGLFERSATALSGQIDPRHGGLGGAPKFPQPFVFEFLWRHYLRSGDAAARTAVG